MKKYWAAFVVLIFGFSAFANVGSEVGCRETGKVTCYVYEITKNVPDRRVRTEEFSYPIEQCEGDDQGDSGFYKGEFWGVTVSSGIRLVSDAHQSIVLRGHSSRSAFQVNTPSNFETTLGVPGEHSYHLSCFYRYY